MVGFVISRLVIVARLEDIRVVQEGLGKIPTDLLSDGLLHGQVPFQVLHVFLSQRLAGVGVVVAISVARFPATELLLLFVAGLQILLAEVERFL